MRNKLVFLFTALFSFITVYSQLESDISKTYLQSNLRYLTSEELEGRETTKRGEDLAAMFIVSELQKYGVQPFGDDGSYFQKIDIRVSSVDQASSVSFSKGNKKYKLNSEYDYLIYSRGFPVEKSEANDLNVVFANYGIISDEYGINDYENLDVKGKAVVVFDDLPESSEFTRADTRKYGTWSGKRKIAKEAGAAALILILSEDYYDKWKGLHSRMYGESFELTDEGEKEVGLPTFALSKNAFIEFFKNEKFSFEEIVEKKEIGENVNAFKTNTTFSYVISEKTRIEEAQNVVGIIKGNSPELNNTYVAVTAHYDHLGIKGDEVYNGADDNGSGTATILEAARQLALKRDNERSILFVFHTGEEKGLLGSKYFTEHAPYVDSIIANINMDMVGREDENKIYCIGSAMLSKQFSQLVKDVNNSTVSFDFDYKFDNPDDPNRYYYRSDHYQYAKRGIPVVFFFDEMTEDYHKVTDDIEKINFNKLKKMATLTVELALEISNLDSRLVLDRKEE